jgi:hypothetical protein
MIAGGPRRPAGTIAAVPGRLAATYLFSRECPSHEEGLRLLREAAAVQGLELELDVVEIRDDREAEARGFPGSPTYLLAGRDPFAPEGGGHAPRADACRAYALPGGRIGPLPHPDDLAEALRSAARAAAKERT